MPGPAPKLNRQRKQTPARGDWVRLAPLDGPVIPELDEFEAPLNYETREVVWPQRTRLLWDSWMEDPATGLWTKSDLAFAVDTIYLHAHSAQGKSSEIRIRMESLGLTPKGRADRRLLLPDEEEPPAISSVPVDGVQAQAPRVLPVAV